MNFLWFNCVLMLLVNVFRTVFFKYAKWQKLGKNHSQFIKKSTYLFIHTNLKSSWWKCLFIHWIWKALDESMYRILIIISRGLCFFLETTSTIRDPQINLMSKLSIKALFDDRVHSLLMDIQKFLPQYFRCF